MQQLVHPLAGLHGDRQSFRELAPQLHQPHVIHQINLVEHQQHALVTRAELPEHLRDNPLVALHLALAPEVEATLARLARRDAADDERARAVLGHSSGSSRPSPSLASVRCRNRG